MEDWQQRVVDEQAHEAEKLDKLDAFMATEKFHGLGLVERNLLTNQRMHMAALVDILKSRIERF